MVYPWNLYETIRLIGKHGISEFLFHYICIYILQDCKWLILIRFFQYAVLIVPSLLIIFIILNLESVKAFLKIRQPQGKDKVKYMRPSISFYILTVRLIFEPVMRQKNVSTSNVKADLLKVYRVCKFSCVAIHSKQRVDVCALF